MPTYIYLSRTILGVGVGVATMFGGVITVTAGNHRVSEITAAATGAL